MSRWVATVMSCTLLAACALVADIDAFESAPPASSTDGSAAADAVSDALSTGDALLIDAAPANGDACACAANETCEGGTCVMATGLQDARELVVAGSFVVFTEVSAGRLRACPVTGCGANGPTLVKDQISLVQLAKPGRGGGRPAAFSSDQQVNGVAYEILDDGTSKALATSGLSAKSIGLNAAKFLLSNAAGVFACTRQDPINSVCGNEPGQSQLGAAASPFVAFAGDAVVWKANGRLVTCSGFNDSCENGNQVGPQGIQGIAPELDGVYAFSSDGEVLHYDLAHHAPSTLATKAGAFAIATDADNVYVATRPGIHVFPKATPAVSMLRYATTVVRDLAASGTHLFWIDDGGRLVRAPR